MATSVLTVSNSFFARPATGQKNCFTSKKFMFSVILLLLNFLQRYLADRFVEGTCPLCAYEVTEAML